MSGNVSFQMSQRLPFDDENNSCSKDDLFPYTSEADSDNASDTPKKERWPNKAEFVLSCIGFSVGLGNLWRFPFVAYENGGGAFLLPYFILLLLVGKPMYLMELVIGQFSGLGPISIWKCFPLATGIGTAMITISMMVSIYYNVIMAYTAYYFVLSFWRVLPWSGCYSWWGADSDCYVRRVNQTYCEEAQQQLLVDYSNYSMAPGTIKLVDDSRFAYVPQDILISVMSNCTNATQTASEQFFNRFVLDISSGIDDLGVVKWDLAVSLLVCWAVIFLILQKGVQSAGKVVYFTATFPYVILIVLLGYGVALEGAMDGIRYFFIPSWNKLLDIGVWRNAAEQLLYSLGVSWGGLIVFSSYNKFDNRVHRDAFLVSSLDFFTSLLSGIVIFSVLGNMSKRMGIDISHVVQGGQGLAFIAYPEALVQLQIPQLWSALFFFMLFLLAVDSQFSYLETLFTALYEAKPKLRRYKALICLITCSICFLLGLPCVTQGGPYVLNLMNTYGGGFALLFVATCELVAIMWGYGVSNFCNDMEFMLGFKPGIYWKICWAFVAPLVLVFLFVYALVKHEVISYARKPYPGWADGIGWLLAVVSMVQIPGVALYLFLKNLKTPTKILMPSRDWGPSEPKAWLRYKKLLVDASSDITSERDADTVDITEVAECYGKVERY